jgi:NAD(P)-dependent dehydrogenase (short-subunit alcohol dehydrogenase family)
MSKDRVAMVTGAGSGIGLAIATRFFNDGWNVALVDRDETAVKEAATTLDPTGGKVHALVADVSVSSEVDAVVTATMTSWERIDALVNNAGVTGPSKPLWDYEEHEWDAVYATNVTAVFLMCRAIVTHMVSQGGGRIVNIASISGKEGNPNMSAYSSSKAAVIGLTKSLAKELATSNVLINAVTPAVIETDILNGLAAETVDYMVQRIPMGRTGKPEEVAALVAWLSSEECTFSTGAVFDISGGRATY